MELYIYIYIIRRINIANNITEIWEIRFKRNKIHA